MTVIASVANAEPTHHALTPAIDVDLAADIAVRSVIVIDPGRREAEAKSEAVMMMVVMMVMMMMPLDELQKRLRLLRARRIVGEQRHLRILHRLEQVGVGLCGR